MVTLICMGGFFLLSCLAAAGLIASAQNTQDAQRAMEGLTLQGTGAEN